MKTTIIWLCLAIVFAIGITTRFQHPELTETQLFLQFWPRQLVAIALVFVVVWLSRRRK